MKIENLKEEQEQFSVITPEQRTGLKLLSVLKPKPGQKIFEIDIRQLPWIIVEANVEKSTNVSFPLNSKEPPVKQRGKLIKKEGCVYRCALNKESVRKKVQREILDFLDKLKKTP